MKENSWLKWLFNNFSFSSKKRNYFLYGIGDDAAIIPFKNEKSYVVTNDLLLENIHFSLEWSSLKKIGYKSLAVNLSDLASMGAVPKYIFLSIAIPDTINWNKMKNFYLGMKPLIEKYKLKILGGDSSRSKNGLFINIFAFGLVENKNILFRKPPKNNDYIYVTGNLGDSALGYHLLKDSSLKKNFLYNDQKELLKSHYYPMPRIREMIYLKSHYKINASIDISDGLIGDLKKILGKSSLGATIDFEKIPKSPTLLKYMEINLLFPLIQNLILNGGEDYEILFFSSKEINIQKFKKEFKTNLQCIGKIDKSKNIKIMHNNKEILIKDQSYQH